MSTKGFQDRKRKGDQLFQSLDKISGGRAGSATTIKLPLELALANLSVVSIDSKNNILEITGHQLRDTDDVIKVMNNAARDIEVFVEEIIDANNIRVLEIPDGLLAGDEVMPMRYSSLKMDASGNLIVSQGPVQFRLDGVAQEVVEDTGNPANNKPLPVKLTGITGDINITANDLNVQLSHNAANPDSVQVGNGTNIMQVNASGEATVRDADSITELQGLRGQLPATVGQKARAASLAVTLSTEDQATQDAIAASLVSVDGKDFATETTLAAILADTGSLDAKDFATETSLVAMSAKLPATLGQKARAASLAVTMSTEDQAIQDSHTTLLTSIDGKDFSTETTLAAMSAKLPANLGQFSRANSMSVTMSTEDQAIQDSHTALLTSIDNNDFATEATLLAVSIDTTSISADTTSIDGKLPATLGQKARAASLAVTLSTEDQAILDAINVNLDDITSAITYREVWNSNFLANPTFDTGTYLSLSTAIPVGVNLREIELKYEDGTPVELFAFDGVSTYTSLGIIAQGEGKIPVQITGDSATTVVARALGVNFSPTNVIANFIRGN